mgnify:CR=1 FL=1
MISTKIFFINLFMQLPPLVPNDGDTKIDTAPIDNYLFIGLIIGLLIGVFVMSKLKFKPIK